MLYCVLVDMDADASDQSLRVLAWLSPGCMKGELKAFMAALGRKELGITRIKRHFQIIYTT